MSSSASSTLKPKPERSSELLEALLEVRSQIQEAAPGRQPTLVAVSKYKPASDIVACHDHEQRDFGENYVQELVEKAEKLPTDIRWHFIGTLQSNKAKTLAAIPNLFCIQTLTSQKAATGLNKGLPESRNDPLNVLLQVNTSGEDSKSGLPPLTSPSDAPSSELFALAKHIVTECPRLRLQGLMTIGALSASLSHDAPNEDFATLTRTRDALAGALRETCAGAAWGEGDDKRLLLSMGMSGDFKEALKAGADVVRVGTGIFGARPKKGGDANVHETEVAETNKA